MKRWAMYYVSTDFIALIMVPRASLQRSTIIHHVVACACVVGRCHRVVVPHGSLYGTKLPLASPLHPQMFGSIIAMLLHHAYRLTG